MLTKERIGPVVATLAAIAGLVLVLTGAGHKADADDDDKAPSAPGTSQVVPAPMPGQVQPAAPGQTRPQAPAPAQQPQKDDDG
ncbi:hypothetical protein [Actinomycetospora sp.]|uniref:hypothetical protein n=1 Tax=Actinomycetospora sp. TaxID=1872135 RepID=UPI002F4107CF